MVKSVIVPMGTVCLFYAWTQQLGISKQIIKRQCLTHLLFLYEFCISCVFLPKLFGTFPLDNIHFLSEMKVRQHIAANIENAGKYLEFGNWHSTHSCSTHPSASFFYLLFTLECNGFCMGNIEVSHREIHLD